MFEKIPSFGKRDKDKEGIHIFFDRINNVFFSDTNFSGNSGYLVAYVGSVNCPVRAANMVEKINDQKDKVKKMMHVKALEDVKEDKEEGKNKDTKTSEESPQRLSGTPVIIEKTYGPTSMKNLPPGLMLSPEDAFILKAFNVFGDMPNIEDLEDL